MFTIPKKVHTAPIKISIAIPPENPQVKGSFIAHAKVRSKAENKAMLEKYSNWEGEGDGDEAMVRELFDRFEGLGNEEGPLEGDAAFAEVLTGSLSAYLVPAVIQAYYEQYGEARQGNSRRLRGR
ncbi:MAG: hypothetical protein IT479_06995 [Xanthomonadales bacterium]|nr:hypothetical protein [Anaerolineae bacterium]MCC6593008.1 hypothetical protein [Xanthomonadales bacterium]MCE7932791.1 hypothetical protein [Xanthomonadales bacterium PRO6]